MGELDLSDPGNIVQRPRGPRSRLPFSSWLGLAEPLTSVPEVPHLQSGRGDNVYLGDRDDG